MNILVLKLGALGNIVLSLAAFAAIRQRHTDARITLLTTAPYADWMAASPWFDRVLIDTRPAWWDLPGLFRLRHMLRAGKFDRVYDLQTSSRSSHYFRLFPRGARPAWSGIAPGCSHPDRDPDRDRIHDIDRQHGQLRQAGVTEIPAADLSWCRGDIARFALPRRFALLVPGSAPHRPVKRWPAAHYRVLADWLSQQGITPVVLGTAGERSLASEICAGATSQGAGAPAEGGAPRAAADPADANSEADITDGADATGEANATGAANAMDKADSTGAAIVRGGGAERTADLPARQAIARDLTGQTDFGDLADLARAAVMAIGNDTGPMHLLATAGCPSLVLFSGDSDPARCAPRGPPQAPPVRVLRRDDLATLTPDEVITEVAATMPVANAMAVPAPPGATVMPAAPQEVATQAQMLAARATA